ncbi:MAG: hypothetical protein NE334_03495 [Lentisphaeraceae bacterium]|nr:hypothetical protein [Lentisphaeraceae bacterium]
MKSLSKTCLDAAKANIIPGLILQFFALSLVASYYYIPAVNDFCTKLSEVKETYGYTFSIISTGIFGGVIPFFIIKKTGNIPTGKALAFFLFYTIFWSYKGFEVDFFYRTQAAMFGTDNSVSTITKKVLFDQLVYCPFFSMPISALIYFWKDCHFSSEKFKRTYTKEIFTFTTPALQVAAWVVWVPGTAIIYSLPSALQIPLFNIVLCFFVLLLNFICDNNTEEKSA